MTAQGTTPPAAPAAPPRPGRGIRVALAVSVALNLGVLGLGIGALSHGGPGGHGDMVREMSFGPFGEALDDAGRKVLRQAAMQRLPDMHAERDQMMADATGILAALRAEPFDPAALDAALGTIRDHLGARMQVGTEIVGTYLKGLTPDARAAFAARLEASLRHGPGDGD